MDSTMTSVSKIVLPLILIAAPAAASPPGPSTPSQDVAPEKSGPVTRQTANRESPLLDFEYSWPQAIASETKLVAQLNDDLSKSYDDALKDARENKVATEQYAGAFHQNLFTRSWDIEGETPQLISLVASTDTFTGGAHPNHGSSALLWERSSDREINFMELFGSEGGFESAVRTRYCELLDEERLKRREGEKLEGEFSECPIFNQLTIAPASGNTGAFSSIQMIADPYVAGPYVEGSYDIAVPVTAELVAALKAEYRGSFEAQRPQ
jgi:hypothetical protein